MSNTVVSKWSTPVHPTPNSGELPCLCRGLGRWTGIIAAGCCYPFGSKAKHDRKWCSYWFTREKIVPTVNYPFFFQDGWWAQCIFKIKLVGLVQGWSQRFSVPLADLEATSLGMMPPSQPRAMAPQPTLHGGFARAETCRANWPNQHGHPALDVQRTPHMKLHCIYMCQIGTKIFMILILITHMAPNHSKPHSCSLAWTYLVSGWFMSCQINPKGFPISGRWYNGKIGKKARTRMTQQISKHDPIFHMYT